MDQQRIGRGLLGTLLFAALVAAATCGGAQAETIVRIGGTGSGLAAMRLLATAYSKTHPDVSIRVVPSLGSGGGIAALANGALDLAISARPLKDAELSLGARAVEYARTPFVFAVHRDVPKTNLTSDEVLDIYAGKTRTWSDGTRIRLILRPMSDSDTQFLRLLSPELDLAVRRAHARPGMTVAVTNQESNNALARRRGALAVSTLTEIATERPAVKMLSYNGVEPTLQNLANKSYLPVKSLYLVTSAKTSAEARHFAVFVGSAQARSILTSTGNLPPSDGKER